MDRQVYFVVDTLSVFRSGQRIPPGRPGTLKNPNFVPREAVVHGSTSVNSTVNKLSFTSSPPRTLRQDSTSTTHLFAHLVFSLEGDTHGCEHLGDLLLFVLHDSLEHLADGAHDELTKSALEFTIVAGLLPLLHGEQKKEQDIVE